MEDVSPPLSRSTPDLGAIFDAHFDHVWNSLRRLGVREADLEDQVHEVFLKVHSRLGDYDPARPLKPWIFAFAFRVAADYRRLARHRWEVFGVRLEAVDLARTPDECIEAQEERRLVEAALEAVELTRRAVLVMHDVEQLPIPQIAESLGVPTGTAYSRLRLAREDFSSALRRFRKQRGER
jgi:RNA polymerase sigma-70 factor (ECF subfamily)